MTDTLPSPLPLPCRTKRSSSAGATVATVGGRRGARCLCIALGTPPAGTKKKGASDWRRSSASSLEGRCSPDSDEKRPHLPSRGSIHSGVASPLRSSVAPRPSPSFQPIFCSILKPKPSEMGLRSTSRASFFMRLICALLTGPVSWTSSPEASPSPSSGGPPSSPSPAEAPPARTGKSWAAAGACPSLSAAFSRRSCSSSSCSFETSGALPSAASSAASPKSVSGAGGGSSRRGSSSPSLVRGRFVSDAASSPGPSSCGGRLAANLSSGSPSGCTSSAGGAGAWSAGASRRLRFKSSSLTSALSPLLAPSAGASAVPSCWSVCVSCSAWSSCPRAS
mmetsp:Transcript_98477/g.303562  ORF Transcript_98477/g.303562 Transcript_98477/m.303562 type:complete len:336 (-) Transcript_98477:123-1130(-)